MKELPKVYEPHAVEDRWIKEWIDKNYFAAIDREMLSWLGWLWRRA